MSEEVEIVEIPSEAEQNLAETSEEDLDSESTTEVENPETEDDESEVADEEVKIPKGVKKRFDKMTKEKYEAKAEADYWRLEATKLKASQGEVTQTKNQPVVPENPEPLQGDFVDVVDFLKAHSKWEVRNEMQAERSAKIAEDSNKAILSAFESRKQEFAKAQPDYDKALNATNSWQVHPDIHATIVESDVGPQIAYHLAKNKAEVDRLNGLSPAARMKELGKLEARLESGAVISGKTTISKAPTQVKPVNGSRASGSRDLSDDAISDREWVKLRNAQIAAKRNGK